MTADHASTFMLLILLVLVTVLLTEFIMVHVRLSPKKVRIIKKINSYYKIDGTFIGIIWIEMEYNGTSDFESLEGAEKTLNKILLRKHIRKNEIVKTMNTKEQTIKALMEQTHE